MKNVVPWRILVHERVRSGLAVAGIHIAILLIFLQLGFYFAVPEGGMLWFQQMRFDLLLVSKKYVFQAQSQTIPRRRLYHALAFPEIASATPVYQNAGLWKSREAGTQTNVFVMGVHLADDVFAFPEIKTFRHAMTKMDTVIVDVHSKPSFGPLRVGGRAEIDDRAVEIAGIYDVGIGFAGLGVVITSDVNFTRLFPGQTLDDVGLGLLRLRPGADPERAAAALRRIMPADTRVFTRDELAEHEKTHWVSSTSTGLVFGFGVIVAFIVGLIILYQTLATQVTRNLPEFAMLKAIGYTDKDLTDIIVRLALFMTVIAYVPAVILAVVIYKITAVATLLPIYMTLPRAAGVFALAIVMSAASALMSTRSLRRADPVELF